MGLHFDEDARVRLGEGVTVGYSLAGHPQLYLGQALAAAEQTKGVGCRFIDVAHVVSVTGALRGKHAIHTLMHKNTCTHTHTNTHIHIHTQKHTHKHRVLTVIK